MRVLAAFDKFRGTLTAPEATAAVASACWELGFDCDEAPLSDGGEGLLDVFGGGNHQSIVTGPLGTPVEAEWRLSERTAVVEMARASGLELAGGAAGNDPLGATTRGTGELIAKAIEQGARTVLVGLGGSATTDGGLGAIEAIGSRHRLRAVDIEVGCDVRTRFVDAAPLFAPQKGATPAQVALLQARLEQLADRYVADFGVDVRDVDGTGAAGGLAGGLLAVGGRLLGGFDLVAEHVSLDERLAAADVVVTGEGHLDAQSLDGKVVGGVCELAVAEGKPVVVIVGDVDDDARADLCARSGCNPSDLSGQIAPRTEDAGSQARRPSGEGRAIAVVSLVDVFGEVRALNEPRWCLEHATRDALGAMR